MQKPSVKDSIHFISYALLLPSLVWLVSFFSIGVYDYMDAAGYAANAANLSRDFTFCPQPISWEAWNAKDTHFGYNWVYANEMYSVLLSFFYSILGQARVWYGCLFSFVGFVFGCAFFYLFCRCYISRRHTALLLFFTATHFLLLQNFTRPLSDIPFWGFSIFLIWFLYTFPQKIFLAGILLGFISLIRGQAMAFLPLLPLLFVREKKWIKWLQGYGWLLLGLIGPFVLIKLIKSLAGFQALPTEQEAFYVGLWKHAFANIDVKELVLNANNGFTSLFSIYEFGMVGCFFIVSLFFDLNDWFLNRLKWFLFWELVFLILGFSMITIFQTRYLLFYVPFILFLGWIFITRVIQSQPAYARYFALMVFVFSLATGPAIFLLRSQYLLDTSPTILAPTDFEEFEAHTQAIARDDVVATNNFTRLTMHAKTKKIVILPSDPDSFLQGEHNHDIQWVLFVNNMFRNAYKNKNGFARQVEFSMYRNLDVFQPKESIFPTDRYARWKPLLKEAFLEDENGNVFKKVHESTETYFQVFLYKRQAG